MVTRKKTNEDNFTGHQMDHIWCSGDNKTAVKKRTEHWETQALTEFVLSVDHWTKFG